MCVYDQYLPSKTTGTPGPWRSHAIAVVSVVSWLTALLRLEDRPRGACSVCSCRFHGTRSWGFYRGFSGIKLDIEPIGSMVLVYMLMWVGYIDGIHVTIYSSTMDPMGYDETISDLSNFMQLYPFKNLDILSDIYIYIQLWFTGDVICINLLYPSDRYL